MATDLATLERAQEQIRDAADRMVRLGDDLLRAQKEGEDSGAFTARATDSAAPRPRSRPISARVSSSAPRSARRAYLEQLQAEIKRLEEAAPSSGTSFPGAGRCDRARRLEGHFDLHLDGTLVTGVYQLSGGWKGSLRGTFIGGDVRLERIDSQHGFVAVYNGRLVVGGSESRSKGLGKPPTSLRACRRPARGSRREGHPDQRRRRQMWKNPIVTAVAGILLGFFTGYLVGQGQRVAAARRGGGQPPRRRPRSAAAVGQAEKPPEGGRTAATANPHSSSRRATSRRCSPRTPTTTTTWCRWATRSTT